MSNIAFGVLLFLCFHLNAYAAKDSSLVFQARYSKKEIKKEAKDIKEFGKIVKSFKKSSQSDNIDLKNSALEELRVQMKKEYEELNLRITSRAKKASPAKRSKDTLIREDLPQGYNPTIKGQFENVDKTEILKGKNETEVLMMYSKILNKENRIIRQLEEFAEFDSSTPASTVESILKNASEFKTCLQEEFYLLNKEKLKK